MKPKIIIVSVILGAIAALLLAGLFVREKIMVELPPAERGSSSSQPESAPKQPKPDSADRAGSVEVPGRQQQSTTEVVVTHRAYTTKTREPAEPAKIVVINNKQYPLRAYKPLAIPNDPQANQWWVTNTKLDAAWDVPRGNHQTVLAIIDTGFGLSHEEFQDRWYANVDESGVATSEQPSTLNCTDRSLPLTASCNLIDDDNDGIIDNETGANTYQNPSRLNCTAQGKPLAKSCNRIDDDINGYVDDVTGWDFINNDNSVSAGELNPNGTGVTHGTMVAGVAAATGNNAKGIAGADWGTKLLPIQALDDDSYGDTLSVGRSIFYAISQGVDVISLSLGSEYHDPYVEEAVQTAIASGIVVVAASGNDGCDCIVYPANYPEVVAVGALNSSSQLASFSSWGQNLDILAPGTSLTTATWQSANRTSAYASGANGTSFATPLIGGMFTRLLSHQPNATPLQLIAALTESTNRLTLSGTVPHDQKLGYGTLDAQKSTQRMITPPSPAILYAFTPVSKGAYLDSAPPSETAGSYFAHQCSPGTVGGTLVNELTKSGGHFFTVSKAETKKAVTSGYTQAGFAHVCLSQPHDNPAAVRGINLFKEFRNIYTPLR